MTDLRFVYVHIQWEMGLGPLLLQLFRRGSCGLDSGPDHALFRPSPETYGYFFLLRRHGFKLVWRTLARAAHGVSVLACARLLFYPTSLFVGNEPGRTAGYAGFQCHRVVYQLVEQ